MSEHRPETNFNDDELSVEELEDAAGGGENFPIDEGTNTNACAGGNCSCGG